MACWSCETCALSGGCLAGMNDDDYVPASFEDVLERLDNGKFPSKRQKMIDFMWEMYHFDYNTRSYIR